MGLPCVLFSCLDATLTLLGQSRGYWAGNYRDVKEEMPAFCELLRYHPLAAVAGQFAWVGLILALLLLLLSWPCSCCSPRCLP
jgi:hypothetical protein